VESVEALFDFAYRSDHASVYRRRREWFEHPPEPILVLWWVPAGHIPSVEEADERLDYPRAHGPTPTFVQAALRRSDESEQTTEHHVALLCRRPTRH
jgi:hypothetical protein